MFGGNGLRISSTCLNAKHPRLISWIVLSTLATSSEMSEKSQFFLMDVRIGEKSMWTYRCWSKCQVGPLKLLQDKKSEKKTDTSLSFEGFCEAYHPSCQFSLGFGMCGTWWKPNSSGLLVLDRLQHRSKIHLGNRTCRSCWQFQQLGSQQKIWGIPLSKIPFCVMSSDLSFDQTQKGYPYSSDHIWSIMWLKNSPKILPKRWHHPL